LSGIDFQDAASPFSPHRPPTTGNPVIGAFRSTADLVGLVLHPRNPKIPAVQGQIGTGPPWGVPPVARLVEGLGVGSTTSPGDENSAFNGPVWTLTGFISTNNALFRSIFVARSDTSRTIETMSAVVRRPIVVPGSVLQVKTIAYGRKR